MADCGGYLIIIKFWESLRSKGPSKSHIVINIWGGKSNPPMIFNQMSFVPRTNALAVQWGSQGICFVDMINSLGSRRDVTCFSMGFPLWSSINQGLFIRY